MSSPPAAAAGTHPVLEVHVEEALGREAPQLIGADLVATDAVLVCAAVATSAQHAAVAPEDTRSNSSATISMRQSSVEASCFITRHVGSK